MSALNFDGSEDDYSSLVASSVAYKLAAKQAQNAEGAWDEEPWRTKVFATVWRCICRHARHAGQTRTEAEKIAEKILIAALRGLGKSQEVKTVAIFKRQLWDFARSYFAALTRGESATATGPYYVSVAWRKKHDPSGQQDR